MHLLRGISRELLECAFWRLGHKTCFTVDSSACCVLARCLRGFIGFFRVMFRNRYSRLSTVPVYSRCNAHRHNNMLCYQPLLSPLSLSMSWIRFVHWGALAAEILHVYKKIPGKHLENTW